MKTINLKERLSFFNEPWTSEILGEVNDSDVKVFKAKGRFVWHKHDNEDRFFLVIPGQLKIKLRESKIVLDAAGEALFLEMWESNLLCAEEEA
jgi:quercetin dioxygenase-like cupin family protein